jgi:hypothetical protein
MALEYLVRLFTNSKATIYNSWLSHQSFPGEIPLPLPVGDIAPDFSLAAATGTERHTFKLSDYRGKKNVVLAFYALDWSPT